MIFTWRTESPRQSDRSNSAVSGPIVAQPKPPQQTAGNFWAEFLRVQSDKLILFALIVVLHYFHAGEQLEAAAVGGLITLIQGQRFKF